MGGGVLLGGEVGADAELLQDHRLAEAPGELARERGRQRQPRQVVLHRIGVRAEEVDQRRERAQRVPVVVAGGLDAPGAVAERDRLGRARAADRLDDEPRPRGDLVARARAAVERHLVRDEPRDDGGMRAEPPRDLAGEPRLLRDEPDVAVEVTSLSPRRVPVLAGHVADDERGDRVHPELDVRVEEVGEPLEHLFVEPLRLGHEVGPVAERPRHGRARARRAPRALRGRRHRRSATTSSARRCATRSWRRAREATRSGCRRASRLRTEGRSLWARASRRSRQEPPAAPIAAPLSSSLIRLSVKAAS